MESSLLVFILALLLLILLINLYFLRKFWRLFRVASKINDRTHTGFRWLFRQLQILEGLKEDLKFERSLPPAGAMAATPDFLKAIADHVTDEKPGIIVECGSGLSTLVIARCLQLNGAGHIYSFDHESTFAEKTRQELNRHGLSHFASVIYAPLKVRVISGKAYLWYDIESLPSEHIDMLVVDGPPETSGTTARYPAGPIFFPRLSARGVVYVDDFARPEGKAVVGMWRNEFKEFEFAIDTYGFEKGVCIVRPNGAGAPGSHF